MKYLIDESVLLELIQYLSFRPYEEVAPLLVKLTQGLSDKDKAEVIEDLKSDGTIPSNDEEKH